MEMAVFLSGWIYVVISLINISTKYYSIVHLEITWFAQWDVAIIQMCSWFKITVVMMFSTWFFFVFIICYRTQVNLAIFESLGFRAPARYTTYTKVCGHPFKWVDLDISATPVADRCIKLSTLPCNLNRQTLAVEVLSDFQHGTFIGCHLSNKSVSRISAPANCKCSYCEVETTRSNNDSSAMKW